MTTAVRGRSVAEPTGPRARAGRLPTLSWRVLRHGPGRGAWNMALDHALALCVREGVGVLRLYRWARPTVSLGRHEPAGAVCGGGDGWADALDLVRRPTGGRAVLHDEELTYAVVVPVGALGGPRATYRRVNEALAAALRAVGADVRVSESGTVAAPDAGPCFRAPAPGEVVADRRKIVGSAQARIGAALLQHGSILLGADPSPTYRTSFPRGTSFPHGTSDRYGLERTGAVGLAELVGPVDEARLGREVVAALQAAVGGRWRDADVSEEERTRATVLEEGRYATREWTWRR